MTASSILSTTLDIVNVAGSVLVDKNNPRDAKLGKGFDTLNNGLGKASRFADRMDRAGGAITSLSSQNTILSRSFIDARIAEEPILPNLNRSLHSWYAAQIISALHLSQMVDSHRTVQDVMSVVQTGHNNRHSSVLGHLADRRIGQETFLANYTGATFSDHNGLESLQDPAAPAEPRDAPATERQLSVRSVDTSDARIGPMGELYEVKITNPTDKNSSVTIPIFIQMQPSIIPEEAAPRFIDMNVSPGYWRRQTMMRAGELTFWKDFIFQRDMIRRQKSLIKDPKTAQAFSDFLKTVAKKDKYALDDVTDRLGTRQSSNLANSVMIFSEDTVAQAKVDSGIDLHNPRDRERYFRDTYTMIIAIIDPLHQRVMIYFNGLDGSVDSSYSDFRPKDAKFDPKDFMVALQAISTNNIGRLR